MWRSVLLAAVLAIASACGQGKASVPGSPVGAASDGGSGGGDGPTRNAGGGTSGPGATETPTTEVVCGDGRAPGDYFAVVSMMDGERRALVHVPPANDGHHLLPLILDFHGYARTAEAQDAYSGLSAAANDSGFIVVTPQGSGDPQGWDIVGVYNENGYDDVSFVSELLRQVESELCVDTDRVYATGMSNGAEMASQVACFLPGIFAAIAPVAGVTYQGCDGGPVAVVAFHGTWDENVPFETAEPAMGDWATHNNCSDVVTTERVSDSVTQESHAGCDGSDVVLYVVDGGGHTWPGAEDESGGVGPTTHEIDATRIILAFFAAHPKRSP